MLLPSLENLSNAEVLGSLMFLKGNENKTVADIVLHLHELDKRGLYRDAGYSSLFAYCREALKYSEGASYRRIQAARALSSIPEIYDLLKSGEMSLCAVAEVVKVKETEDRVELIKESVGKAKSEVQKLAVKYMPCAPILKVERIVPKRVEASEAQTKTHFTVTLEVEEEFMKLVEKAKAFTGPVPLNEIFMKCLTEYVNKREKAPVRKSKESKNKETRYIPKFVRHEVFKRDEHRCTFCVDGHRCSETQRLQIDHINPFAKGGKNEISNLRLLCPAHNQLFAERAFGKEKMEIYRHGGGGLN